MTTGRCPGTKTNYFWRISNFPVWEVKGMELEERSWEDEGGIGIYQILRGWLLESPALTGWSVSFLASLNSNTSHLAELFLLKQTLEWTGDNRLSQSGGPFRSNRVAFGSCLLANHGSIPCLGLGIFSFQGQRVRQSMLQKGLCVVWEKQLKATLSF